MIVKYIQIYNSNQYHTISTSQICSLARLKHYKTPVGVWGAGNPDWQPMQHRPPPISFSWAPGALLGRTPEVSVVGETHPISQPSGLMDDNLLARSPAAGFPHRYEDEGQWSQPNVNVMQRVFSWSCSGSLTLGAFGIIDEIAVTHHTSNTPRPLFNCLFSNTKALGRLGAMAKDAKVL